MGRHKNPSGKIAFVPIGEMIVDQAYQGRSNTRIVNKIAENWDNDLAGVVVLSYRDGKYYVVDGQHRVLAAQKAGVYKLRALIYEDKPQVEEAGMFTGLNFKHNTRLADVFKSNLLAGHTKEREINHAVHEIGMRVADVPHDPMALRSVSTLYNIYENYSLDLLRTVLDIVKRAFGSYPDFQKAVSAEALLGLTRMLHRYPDLDKERLINAISKVAPTTLAGTASLIRDERSLGANRAIAFGIALTNLYNSGLNRRNAAYLPLDKWTKQVYSPKGKEAQAAVARQTLKKIRARQIGSTSTDDSLLAAAKTTREK